MRVWDSERMNRTELLDPWAQNGVSPGQINSALGKTGSNYKVYEGNPVDLRAPGQGGRNTPMTNQDRFALADMNGMAARANAVDQGGGQKGGGMGGTMGGIMGGMGGGGGGDEYRYQNPPVGETQAQMIERQYALRRQNQKQKVSNLVGILGQVFGMGGGGGGGGMMGGMGG